MSHPSLKSHLLTAIIAALLLPALAGCRGHSTVIKPGKEHVKHTTRGSRHTSNDKPSDNKTTHKPEKSGSAAVNAIIKEAQKWLGTPYRSGGASRQGTDCSGFVMTVFLEGANIRLPRDSRSQQAHCRPIKVFELQPGDLVFFAGSRGSSTVSHVGLYIGNNSFIHASTSRGVIISALDEPYYVNHFHSAGRVEALKLNAKTAKQNTPEQHAPNQAGDQPEDPKTGNSVKTNRNTRPPKTPHTTRGQHPASRPDTILNAWMD